MSSARAWTWREAGPHDRDAQCQLFNTCFRKQKGVDTFVWKYERNPHGPAVGRLALDAAGRIVGAYSYVPRRFRRDGQRIVLAQASDAMVAPEARRQGIFTGLDDIVCEATGALGVPLAFAYSGRLSYTGFLGNGWKDIGRASVWRYRYRSERGLLRLGRIAPLATLLAGPQDALFARRDRRRFAAGELRLQRIGRFDDGITPLCEACVPARGLVGERDAAWLNWRYVDNPSRRQECYLLPGKAPGPPAGLLVAEFVDGNAFLVDHLAADEGAREALLHDFARLGWQRGMHEATALLFDHHPSVSLLARQGWTRPLHRKLFRDIFPFIVRPCRADAGAADEDIRRWLLADGDRDAEHMSA